MNCRRRLQIALVAGLGIAGLVHTAGAAEVVKYYHSDAIGNVRAVTDRAGNVLERFEYYPFGEDVSAPSTPTHRRFKGKERDDESGLDYFGARHYLARTARFTSVDPFMGVEKNITNPQRWNRYAYAANNPLRFVDPDGRDWVAQVFLGERGKDVSTWQALTGAEAQAHYSQTAVEHPFLTGQITLASTLFTGVVGEVVGGVMNFAQLTKARASRNELAESVKQAPGEPPAAATGGYNTSTGQVTARCSGGGKCAEDHVFQALGGDAASIRFTEAIRPRTGREVPVCTRCETTYGRDAFPSGTQFKSDDKALPPQ